MIPNYDKATDEKIKNEFLDYIKQLPEGFIDELIMPYEGMDVFIVSSISSKLAEQGGVASEHNLRLQIVLAVDSFKTIDNVHHELLHAFEFSMNKRAGKNVFLDWNKLNPADFSYYNNSDPWKYTFYGELSNIENVWFVDDYAKTKDEEDRARVVEYATADNWNVSNLFNSSHMRAKLQEISDKLRTYYPSLTDADTLPWERPLKG